MFVNTVKTNPVVEDPVTLNEDAFPAPVMIAASLNALANKPEVTDVFKAEDNWLYNAVAAADELLSPLGVLTVTVTFVSSEYDTA